MRPARCWPVLALWLACAGPAAETTGSEEATAAQAPPLSPERQRLERWKQGAAGDPREGFARAAESEAERRRSEALARGYAPGASALEAAERARQVEALASFEGGCFASEPDLTVQDDWIAHRALVRDDFRAEAPPGAKPGGAHASIRLTCVATLRASESDGQYTVELGAARFFALLSRDLSWWSVDAGAEPERRLRHQQLHFDIAELFAGELNARAAEIREATRERRPDPDAAAFAFRARLAEQLAAQQRGFEEVARRYDRETMDGNDPARQSEWLARAKRGLAAVRDGS
jgi:hypothetical protein